MKKEGQFVIGWSFTLVSIDERKLSSREPYSYCDSPYYAGTFGLCLEMRRDKIVIQIVHCWWESVIAIPDAEVENWDLITRGENYIVLRGGLIQRWMCKHFLSPN